MKNIVTIFAAICMATLGTYAAHGQDTTARILYTWPQYAGDTNLTFRQIVTMCDSIFSLAGYSSDTVAQYDTSNNEEGSSYAGYCEWKNFWSSRLDQSSGKLHQYARGAFNRIISGTNYNSCYAVSALQSSLGTAVPNYSQE